MSATAQAAEHDSELFNGGPPLRIQRSLGLIRPDDPRLVHQAVLAALIGWAPLAVLTVAQDLWMRNGAAKSFFLDFAVNARSLLAVPVLILAEGYCLPRLTGIAYHFLNAGFVTETDRPRFDETVSSTRRLLHSSAAEVLTVVLAYALVASVLGVAGDAFPVWHKAGGGVPGFSPAGWWHALISLPLLLILLLGWLWRIALWGRFLWRMSRLNLRLIAAHPDHAGGLQFVSTSLRDFSVLCFGLGVVVAGAVTSRVVHNGASLETFKNVVGGLVAIVLLLFAGPLLVFVWKLMQVKRRAILEYGALASAVGGQFESKWLRGNVTLEDSPLEAPDFSATTDLYQIVGNVYALKLIPFEIKSLAPLVVGALLPFLPVVLTTLPLLEIIKNVAKMLV